MAVGRKAKPPLSEDVVMEIFARLPMQSVKRFRLTCKLWCKLMSPNAYFQSLHLSRSNQKPPNLLYFSTIPNHQQVVKLSMDSEATNIGIPVDLPHSSMEISLVGFCNGLLCLLCSSEDDIFVCIWNPGTNKHIELPYPNTNLDSDSLYFGFSPQSKEYKLVRIDFVEYLQNVVQEVRIYTLGKKSSWRRIHHKPGLSFCIPKTGDSHRGAFLNGAFHWISKSYDRHGYVITSLCLTTENLGEMEMSDKAEIPLPKFNDPKFQFPTLSVLQGCLCTLILKEEQLEVWQMKDYGRVESWTKLFSIERSIIPYKFSPIQPLFVNSNGELVLLNLNTVILYDSVNKRIINPRVSGVPPVMSVSVYVETLTSLAAFVGGKSSKRRRSAKPDATSSRKKRKKANTKKRYPANLSDSQLVFID